MDVIDGMSMDIEQAERDKLRAVFPQCFVEDKLDIDKLLSLCGEYITDDFEKYEFKWKGKSECLQLAQKRSTGTLRPCKEESVHFDTTQNLYIEGDNLEVLKLLQTSYYRKVKMIYIDPPYNTGHDFVYADDFADPMARYKEVTSQTTKSNPETMGRYHTNWLNMMYPRLRLAANLLRDDGICFISIDDNEQANLRKVCDEVFGEENFAGLFPWRKRTAKSDVPFGVSQDYEWVLCYAKTDDFSARIEGGTRKYFETDDFPGRPWRIHDLTTQRSALERPNSNYTMVDPKTGAAYPVNPNRTWAVTKETFDKYYNDNRIVFPGDYDFLNISKPAFRYFKEDDMAKAGDNFGFIPVSTNLPGDIGMTQDGTKEITELFDNKVFGYPKPLALVKHLINAATSANRHNRDIIFDFFSGSATTAHAVMQLNAEDGGNRRFIMVQLPEICDEKSEACKAGYKNICEIGKERIRRAGARLLEQGVTKTMRETVSEQPTQTRLTDDGMIERESTAEYLIKTETKMAPALDVGFRVFKLDTSNLKIWDNTPIPGGDITELERRLRGMLEIVKNDRDNLDVVYEVMLKLGQDLCEDILTLDINGKAVYGVGAECDFIVCLTRPITAEDAEAMAEYAPGRIIFTDQCFDTSSDKRNVQLTLKDRGITMKML